MMPSLLSASLLEEFQNCKCLEKLRVDDYLASLSPSSSSEPLSCCPATLTSSNLCTRPSISFPCFISFFSFCFYWHINKTPESMMTFPPGHYLEQTHTPMHTHTCTHASTCLHTFIHARTHPLRAEQGISVEDNVFLNISKLGHTSSGKYGEIKREFGK